MKQKEILNGHGFFRKSKAYGLVCGIALGLAFLGGQVSADEITTTSSVAPVTEVTTTSSVAATEEVANTNINTVEAMHTDVTENTTDVAIDNSSVESAVTNAENAGVEVSNSGINDYGVATTTDELTEAETAIKADQENQVKNLTEVTEKQNANNDAYNELKDTVDENNGFVEDAKSQFENAGVGNLTIEDDKSTLTNGSAEANIEANKTAEATLEANRTALSNYLKAVENYNLVKSQNNVSKQAIEEAKQKLQSARQEVLSLADSTSSFDDSYFKLTENTTIITPDYVSYDGLTGEALKEAISKNQSLYEEVVAHAIEVANESKNSLSEAIEDYNNKTYVVVNKTSEESGIVWTDNTTVEAVTGAEKVSGGRYVDSSLGFEDESIESAAKFAISGVVAGGGAVENTDAKFDNIFYIGTGGTLLVKNTSNGDVSITFSNIDSSTFANYVAIWGDNNGGIAWGLFNLYSGSGSAGSSVESGGAGEGSTSGNMVGLVRAYDFTITTTGNVADFTFNDIDNLQDVAFSGNSLDNSTVHIGANITDKTNGVYSAGAGDVSEGSLGVLGSNGIHVAYTEIGAKTITGRHTTYSTTNGIQGTASIVAGIFGLESIREHETVSYKPIDLTISLEDVKLPQEVVLNEPSLHLVTLATPVNQILKAEYHDYALKEYVAPETPTPTVVEEVPVVQSNILPMTGDETTPLNIIVSAFGALMFMLGIFGIRRKKEDK